MHEVSVKTTLRVKDATYQIVELDGGDTLVNTSNDLHGDRRGIDVLWVEAITEPRHTGCDLVELDALLAAI